MSASKTVTSVIPQEKVEQVVGKFAEEFGRHLEQAGDALRATLETLEVQYTIEEPEPQTRTPETLPGFCAKIRAASGQVEALRALLAGAAESGARAAVLVLSESSAEIWDGTGFDDDGSIKGRTIPREHPAVSVAAAGTDVLCGDSSIHEVPQFGQGSCREALVSPIEVQGSVVGLLYADDGDQERRWDPDTLRTLATVTGLAVERQALAKALARATGSRVQPTGPVAQQVAEATADAAAAASPSPSSPAPPPPAPPASAAGPQDTPAVEDARRFARLLMEEICLYNADKVEAGRQGRDLLERLGDEVEQARQMYRQRVEESLPDRESYFDEAVVKVLASGDPAALGVPA